jgi:hypothetical protein
MRSHPGLAIGHEQSIESSPIVANSHSLTPSIPLLALKSSQLSLPTKQGKAPNQQHGTLDDNSEVQVNPELCLEERENKIILSDSDLDNQFSGDNEPGPGDDN